MQLTGDPQPFLIATPPLLLVSLGEDSRTLEVIRRTEVFAWYNLVGSVATAAGALGGGLVCQVFIHAGVSGAPVYRPIIVGYGVIGLVLAGVFFFLSRAAEAPSTNVATARRLRRVTFSGRAQRAKFSLQAP